MSRCRTLSASAAPMAHSFSGVSRADPSVRELNVPPEVLRRLAVRLPETYPVLFDSVADGPLSKASILAACPRAALWVDSSGRLGAEGLRPRGDTFLAALENWWLSERLP